MSSWDPYYHHLREVNDYHELFLKDLKNRSVQPGAYPKFCFGPFMTVDIGEFLLDSHNAVYVEIPRPEGRYETPAFMDLCSVFYPKNWNAYNCQRIRVQAVYDYSHFHPKAKVIEAKGIALKHHDPFHVGRISPCSEEEKKYLSELPLITSEFEFEKYQQAALKYLESKNIPIVRAKSKESEGQVETPKLLQFTKTA